MIKLKGVHLSFAENRVLSGVDLEVAEGETVALIGPSGCGKTTLLKVAVGLLQPQAGEVWLAGKKITAAGRAVLAAVRKQVGMLFQGNALFDSLNAAENVGFVLREVQRLEETEISRRVASLLEALHLGDIKHKMPAELSGGMKKRVGLARAMIGEPRIILYDDPTAGLDPITSDAIANLILDMKQRIKATSILVSNQTAVVKKLADRVVMLREGRLFELGPAEQMLDQHYFVEPGPTRCREQGFHGPQ